MKTRARKPAISKRALQKIEEQKAAEDRAKHDKFNELMRLPRALLTVAVEKKNWSAAEIGDAHVALLEASRKNSELVFGQA